MIRKTRREFLTSGSAACLTLALVPQKAHIALPAGPGFNV
jgi:hypothetical protein